MSGSAEHDWVALVSMDNQATTGGLVNTNVLDIDFTERQTMLETAQEVLRRGAQYTEPQRVVQRVYDHPAKIIALLKQITDLLAQ